MKKLQKLSLTSNENEFKIIGAREADSLRGGYTQAQMDSMMANGTWTGGQVDGMGYVAAPITCFSGSGCYSSGSELLDEDAWYDRLASFGIGQIPGLGDYSGYLEDEADYMKHDFAQAAWSAGLTSDALLYIGFSPFGSGSTSHTVTLYNASTGQAITNGTMGAIGWSVND